MRAVSSAAAAAPRSCGAAVGGVTHAVSDVWSTHSRRSVPTTCGGQPVDGTLSLRTDPVTPRWRALGPRRRVRMRVRSGCGLVSWRRSPVGPQCSSAAFHGLRRREAELPHHLVDLLLEGFGRERMRCFERLPSLLEVAFDSPTHSIAPDPRSSAIRSGATPRSRSTSSV